MTLDVQRLLLAAEVRNIAVELRNAAAKKAVTPAGNAGAEQKARLEWVEATPLAAFIPQALTELHAIADLMPR